MSRYERTYGTDWERLSADEAVERAYAVGVAERLGERNRAELRRLYESVDSTYDRSMVELAYEQGRSEAKSAAAEVGTPESLWSTLVTDGPVELPEGKQEAGGLPPALSKIEMLDFSSPDSTDSLDLPEFLD
jgi:hypothetical protein